MPAIIPVVAAVAGGAIVAGGANRAASTQANAARDGAQMGVAENARQFDIVQQLLAPYIQAGNRGTGAYEGLLGLAGPQAQQQALDAIQNGPQFGTLARQGEQAILQNASATGGLRSGNTQTALAGFRSNLFGSLIDKQLAQYLPLMQGGQASAAGVGQAATSMGQQNAGMIAGAANQAGAAEAGGQLAGARALSQTIGGVGGIVAANWPGAQPSAGYVPGSTPYGASTVGMSF